jgi:hypothetical protein
MSKRPRKTRKTPSTRRPRASRQLLVKLLTDLCGRLDDIAMTSVAIAETSKPTPEMRWGEWSLRKMFHFAADAQQRQIRDVQAFAKIIHENAARGAQP